jgi:hypothetical protein
MGVDSLNDLPIVACITATCGRHQLVERVTRFFLNQDYIGRNFLLIFNNSEEEQILDTAIFDEIGDSNKDVILINNYKKIGSGEPYTNLGQIYTDALVVCPDSHVITFMDDDDIFLKNHISEGVKGLIRGGKKAYKPAQSYFRHPGGIGLMSNTLEPSMFVERAHVDKHGFHDNTTAQHLKWVDPLVQEQEIFVDPSGTPTLIYNWGDVGIPTFKTSGNAGDPNNFNNYRKFSTDHGDRIITPQKSVDQYYSLIKN